MKNIILKSTDEELNKFFQSEKFYLSNYEHDWDTGKETLYLKEMPKPGEYLYFIDDVYNQIAVKVVSISRNSCQVCILCEPALLSNIDPFIYTGNEINEKFRVIVDQCFFALKNKVEKELKEDDSRIHVYAVEISKRLDIADNTLINYTNVLYTIKEILSQDFETVFGKWHKPYPWEYSDF